MDIHAFPLLAAELQPLPVEQPGDQPDAPAGAALGATASRPPWQGGGG